MKLNQLLFSLFISAPLLSCSNSDDNNVYNYHGTMEAKINGELVVFYSAYGYGFFDLDNHCDQPFHSIIGDWEFNAPDGHSITLYFNPGIGTYIANATYLKWDGPYNDGNNIVGYNQYHFNAETNTYIQENGEVTITSTSNDRYKGTFYFTAVNENGKASELGLPEKVIITNGKFDIAQKSPLSCN